MSANYDAVEPPSRGKGVARNGLTALEMGQQHQELTAMQPGIRIVKREARNRMNSVSVSVPKSDRERERENVDTVKGWVSEWEKRKRQLQSAADALIAQCVVAARERRGRCELNTLMTRTDTL